MSEASSRGRPYRRLVAQLKATSRVCWLCGRWIDVSLPWWHDWSWSVDHVVPKSLGGKDTLDNMRAAHRLCNLRRGNRPHRPGLRTSRQW